MKFTTIANAKIETGFAYLGRINSSAKLVKNMKVGHYTYSLNLSPANTSGHNVCPNSTPECRLGCLATSGHAKFEIHCGRTRIKNSRIKKTQLFYSNTSYFIQWLIADLKYWQNKAKADGYFISARLITLSDINWQNVLIDGKNIFQLFPEIQFYDYSKTFSKFNDKPNNYHLTFSYTGRNWVLCEQLLEAGYNVAVIFKIRNEIDLPKSFMGYPVVNGDENDARFMDKKGVIVGLKWKRIADKEAETKILNSCFVVDPAKIEAMVPELVMA
jgi:hypothetical protein